MDDDGNVVLVMANVEADTSATCSIINEVAENNTTCLVTLINSLADLQTDADVVM